MMKKFLALFLSLLMVATLLVGMLLPVSADNGTYTATFEGKTFPAVAENASDERPYFPTITASSDTPAAVLDLVEYKMDGEKFNGISNPGTYTITAYLPAGYFVDAEGNPLSTLTATFTLERTEQNTAVIVYEQSGNKTATAYAEVKEATLSDGLTKKFAAFKALSFEIKKGSEGAKYLLRISIDPKLVGTKSKGISEKSLYVYEDGKLVPLTEKGYKVVLKETDQTYSEFEVSDVPAGTQMTIVMGVEKSTFPWWWILIALLVLLLVVMYLVGRAKTKREEAAAGDAASEGTTGEPSAETPKTE